jgi:cysteinyl-tRNA synthetase
MDDDFNTPAAIAQFQHLRGEVNRLLEMELSRKAREKALEAFRALGQVLGLFQISWRDWEFKDLYPPVGWMNKGTQTVFPAQPKERHPTHGITGTEVILPPLSAEQITDEQIKRMIDERNEARRDKDFARADFIRKALAVEGIILEDRPDGTTRWKR